MAVPPMRWRCWSRSCAPIRIPTKADVALYVVAGIAARKADNNPQALEYWRKALDVENDPRLAAMYASVDREVKSNLSKPVIFGLRVKLLYDDGAVPSDMAHDMLAIIDDTYGRVSAELGCTTNERITAIVTSRQAYMSTTGAPEWSGGLFDGRIHIPASAGKQMNAEDRRALTHETVHACLAMMGNGPDGCMKDSRKPFPAISCPPPGVRS